MKLTFIVLAVVLSHTGFAQKTFTHADTLRGSLTPERVWWDVLHYDLHVQFNYAERSLAGMNTIQYKVLRSSNVMQLDLMSPLVIDSIVSDGKKLTFKSDGNAHFVSLPEEQKVGENKKFDVYYHGIPHVAVRAPWDGGTVWAKDKLGRPWITVACEGFGASSWFPNKDHLSDEPDSMSIHITVPDSLIAVSNGRLKSKVPEGGGMTTSTWTVRNPINSYNIIPYIAKYAHFSEVYPGEKGNLDVDYWVLDYRLEDAKRHMQPDVRKTLKHLEYWFGPYPFYEDGFKMVETSHLGMEHQSAVAYGNGYQNGYLGRDLSQSGWGLKWDFIIVHESAHEWFGNNISVKDHADMWIHEGFANYSETLFTESEYGKEAGSDYIVGSRKGIKNDRPIIATYNVNKSGSGDMYPKGGNMIHNIRQIMDDDEKFRQMLRGLNKDFYHQTVTTQEIENYISKKAGRNLSKVFDQYLRGTDIPVFSYSVKSSDGISTITYKWENCVDNFDMPVRVVVDGKPLWLYPGTKKKSTKFKGLITGNIVDRNFYVTESRVGE